MTARDVFVLAAEPSGDRILGLVSKAIGAERCWGLGGPSTLASGVEVLDPTFAARGAMGALDVAVAAPRYVEAILRATARARREPPRVAVLVNATELAARAGVWLRARGTRVLWCVAPQVWAWRPGRARSLARSMDRLAVLFPFEVPLWRAIGVDARYVGHPSFQGDLKLSKEKRAGVVVLPGSRRGEVRRLAEPLAFAAARLIAQGAVKGGAMLLAPWLDEATRAFAANVAEAAGLTVERAEPLDGAAGALARFRCALVCSGTASLEAALAGAAPVVAYRLDAAAALVASRLLETPYFSLPNVILGRREFPELAQAEVTAENVANAAEALLARPWSTAAAVRELRAKLAPPSDAPFGERVAALVAPWLC